MNEKVLIEVFRRRLEVEMEGFTPFEIHNLARHVESRMRELESKSNIADSSKLAILAALDVAGENSKLEDAYKTAKNMTETKIEQLIMTLQSALDEAKQA